MIVTSPSCLPGIVTLIVLFSLTQMFSDKTVNCPLVAYTSNSVSFVSPRYLSSPRYSPATPYNPITGVSRCNNPLPSFTLMMYDLIISDSLYKVTLTLPVASIGTSTVMLTLWP